MPKAKPIRRAKHAAICTRPAESQSSPWKVPALKWVKDYASKGNSSQDQRGRT
jgi:hypothetical protein